MKKIIDKIASTFFNNELLENLNHMLDKACHHLDENQAFAAYQQLFEELKIAKKEGIPISSIIAKIRAHAWSGSALSTSTNLQFPIDAQTLESLSTWYHFNKLRQACLSTMADRHLP